MIWIGDQLKIYHEPQVVVIISSDKDFVPANLEIKHRGFEVVLVVILAIRISSGFVKADLESQTDPDRADILWKLLQSLVVTVLQQCCLECLVNPTVRSSLIELKFGSALCCSLVVVVLVLEVSLCSLSLCSVQYCLECLVNPTVRSSLIELKFGRALCCSLVVVLLLVLEVALCSLSLCSIQELIANTVLKKVSGNMILPNTKGVEGVKILVDGSLRSVTDKDSYYKIDQYHPDKNQGNDEATRKFAEINKGKSVAEYSTIWEMKKEDLMMKEKLSKLAILDTLLAKKDPLTEAEEVVKNKLLAEYF
ncbi:hypothetical protein F2Q70_00026348 [Brassica cretica]|uniref:Uncharacterized protein n=1 Tax=Brassica cretica TaxID=69181 RepID=A0A8S9L912_BRACR|nr:hypothetical protein F2Q70_00026348 [Brassica cretica]